MAGGGEVVTRGDRRFRMVSLAHVDVEVQGYPQRARVMLTAKGSGERFETITGLDGFGVLEDVPAGTYLCQAVRQGRKAGKVRPILIPELVSRVRLIIGATE